MDDKGLGLCYTSATGPNDQGTKGVGCLEERVDKQGRVVSLLWPFNYCMEHWHTRKIVFIMAVGVILIRGGRKSVRVC